jgi:hypothetical protein
MVSPPSAWRAGPQPKMMIPLSKPRDEWLATNPVLLCKVQTADIPTHSTPNSQSAYDSHARTRSQGNFRNTLFRLAMIFVSQSSRTAHSDWSCYDHCKISAAAQVIVLTCVVANNFPVVAVSFAVSLKIEYWISWWSIPTIDELEWPTSLIWNRRILWICFLSILLWGFWKSCTYH